MKKLLALTLALVVLLSFVSCGRTDPGTKEEPATDGSGIKIWVSSDALDLTKKQVEAFKAANPDVTIDIYVAAVGDYGDCATQLLEDPESAADIFLFSQDQLSRLVSAGMLTELSEENAEEVKITNNSVAVSAATIADKLYAYPLTSDNGYFLYYDKNVIKEDQIDDLATLVKACETADKTFCMRYDDDSAWYTASFFIATGCVSEWETDDEGNFVSYNDTFNSEAGIKALKGLKILADSPIAYSATTALNFSKDAAVIISGAWEAEAVRDILGKYMGVADLPSFTVDGETYHMGSFAGYKLLGVKPQTDDTRASVCQRLAAYLSGEACQLERYDALGWGPTNNNALADDNVQKNAALMALAEQSQYAIPQGQFPSEWWNIAAGFGSAVKRAKTDADLQEALDNYSDAIKNICK